MRRCRSFKETVRKSLFVSSMTLGWSCPATCSCTATCNTHPVCGPSPISCRRRSSRFARFCREAISLAAERASVPRSPRRFWLELLLLRLSGQGHFSPFADADGHSRKAPTSGRPHENVTGPSPVRQVSTPFAPCISAYTSGASVPGTVIGAVIAPLCHR